MQQLMFEGIFEDTVKAKPILKWAGGKTQLLQELQTRIPKSYNRYFEPFLGGGALFFHLEPENALISDSNPELINMYQQVADNVDAVIYYLKKYKNDKETFYAVRTQDWQALPKPEAAARMIFLNKTCFNGLYRVNKKGYFNVPYGNYKNPIICDEPALRAASEVLKGANIVCADFMDVLEREAQRDDLIFLDPPYVPTSKFSDFKRYTKEQFSTEDQERVATLAQKLHKRGCYIIATNSNSPLVHELYKGFTINVVQTQRRISCNGQHRVGEDVIITNKPEVRKLGLIVPLSKQVDLYPPTRFMGSKSKLLDEIWKAASQFQFNSAVDLFSGSGIVGYMFKSQGKKVTSNDYMAMSATYTKAMVENNNVTLPLEEAEKLLEFQGQSDHFVANTFSGLYYTDKENDLIDTLRWNISQITDEYKRSIAMTALIRACLKKRPRGIYTYVGNKYDDGRRDLKLSLEEHFLSAVSLVNNAVFDNGYSNKSVWGDAMDLEQGPYDLVYIDPPYYSMHSDNQYVRRYHFVEGLARNWEGVKIQENTKTKKFQSYPTPFSTKNGAALAFDCLFKKFSESIMIISYSSNSLPTKEEMCNLLGKYKSKVEVIPINYTYSFGNQSNAKSHRNKVQEYLFVAY